MFLIVLVVNDPYICQDLLKSWKEAGVPGATIIDSLGLRKALSRIIRDNLPLMPSFDDIEQDEETRNRTVFSVVPDHETVERVKAATETILGPLKQQDTGFLFVVSVKEAYGFGWN